MECYDGPLGASLQIAKDLVPCVIGLSADLERDLSLCSHCRLLQALPAWGMNRMGQHGVFVVKNQIVNTGWDDIYIITSYIYIRPSHRLLHFKLQHMVLNKEGPLLRQFVE